MIIRLIEQNQKQRKLLKSKLYKEMLDNQVLMNQQYKLQQQLINSRIHHHTNRHNQPQESRQKTYDRRYTDSLEHGGGRDQAGSGRVDRKIILPSIEDRHVLYKGSSRYLVVDSQRRLKGPKLRIRTQHVYQEDEGESTLEELIGEMRIINQGISRRRLKRRYRQPSGLDGEGGSHRRQRSQQSHFQKQQQKMRNQSSSRGQNPQSVSTNKKGRKRGVSRFNLEQQQKQREERIRIIQETLHLPTPNKTRQSNKDIEPRSKQPQRVIGDYKVSDPQIKVQESTAQLVSSQSKNRQRKRQNFLQVLRKVKNRGQSLYLKLSKYPFQKQ